VTSRAFWPLRGYDCRDFRGACAAVIARQPALPAKPSLHVQAKQEFIGIYTLEADLLKWCVSPQKVRPQTFETKKGQFLLILKRQKP
jgi:hypothetical protein